MRATTVDDPGEFLALTETLRTTQPVLTNVIADVAASVLGGRRYDRCWWWLVHDDERTVVGCAIRTAPWNLVVADMPAAAALALGRAVAATDPLVPGVTGPAEVVDSVLAGLADGRQASVSMNDVVYVLGDLVAPPAVPGGPRHAGPEDLGLLVAWYENFARDTGVPAHDVPSAVGSRLAQGSFWLWVVDGEPVAMAGHGMPVEGPGGAVARIGPVYTPEPQRRRGFGAAVTAAVVRQLLGRCTTVMLFADAANATSNGVYQRLGFRPVARVVETTLH